MIDCEFSNNEPYGLRFRAGSTLEGCLFSGNTGRGGLWCSGGYWEPDLYVQECTFTGNQGGQGAGAKCHFQVHAWFTDCVFESNTASDSGGGVMVDYDSRAAFEGCTFVGNSAPIGAGLFVRYYSFARLFRCTVSDNSASAASGAVDVALDSEATVNRTIVAHSTTGCAISIDSSSDGWAACSDLFGNADGDWVGVIGDYSGLDGNISADPLFCGDALPATPYALDASSPCTGWANPQCQLVGAWHIGCGSTAAEQMSWGAIKGLFR